jgi:hypothetical protein
MSGMVDEAGVLASQRAGFGSDPAAFTSIIDTLHADGSFTLGAARLATINGGALADGEHLRCACLPPTWRAIRRR